MGALQRVIAHIDLGTADYAETLALQRRLHARRCSGDIEDILLSVEHPPVLTIGRSGTRDHVLASPDTLEAHGIVIHEVERGGDITYHGPGQLVMYPILDLRNYGRSVHQFVRTLEEGIVRALGACGIEAGRRRGYPGVWVEGRKIASLGVYVKRWVSYHGVAVNVFVNPDHFRLIRPCGLSIETVSVNDLIASPVALNGVRKPLIRAWSELWGARIETVDREELI